MVYKQQYSWQCGSYASLNALQHSWVKATEQGILSLGTIMWFLAMSNKLRKSWYIKSLSYPLTQRQANQQLARGVAIIAKLTKNNFKSILAPNFINDLNWVMGHFVCIIEDCWDKYKYIDQQGEWFGDKWYAYLLKSDFSKFTCAKFNF